MVDFAPIVIFGFQRLDTISQTVSALQRCPEAEDSDLFFFLDAARKKEQEAPVAAVYKYAQQIKGFKSIEIYKAPSHKGLANSVISGVSEILKRYNQVIILEDDLKVSENFLSYMNQSLSFYEEKSDVFSISGFSFPIRRPSGYVYDNYFTKRSSSWGWGTWKKRWDAIDWTVPGYEAFSLDKKMQKKFDEMGSDLTDMLKRHKCGRIDSWAIRWVYHQFKQDLYTVYPTQSKVRNIGFGNGATHTSQRYNRFDTVLDSSKKTSFNFNPDVNLDKYFVRNFVRRYGIYQRAFYKILNFFK